jgi:hypothetical protein
MWELRRLTTVWASMVCYMGGFTLYSHCMNETAGTYASLSKWTRLLCWLPYVTFGWRHNITSMPPRAEDTADTRVRNSQPLVPILIDMKPAFIIPSYFLEVHLILSSHLHGGFLNCLSHSGFTTNAFLPSCYMLCLIIFEKEPGLLSWYSDELWPGWPELDSW